ncbi:hypothetical protein THH46_12005 [Pseudomonas sp. NA13]
MSLARRKDVLPYSNRLTSLHYDPERSRDYIFEVCKQWQSRFGPKSVPPRPEAQDRAPDRCLRIGLVSDGLRQHPVGNMIVGCWRSCHGISLNCSPTAPARYVIT